MKLRDLFKLGSSTASWRAKLGISLAVIIAIGIALFATYKIGYSKGKNLSEIAVVQYESKIIELSTRLIKAQAEVTIRVVTKYVTDIAYQDRILYQNRDVIRTIVAPREDGATVTNGWIYAHNQLAGNLLISDYGLASDATASGISDNDVLGTIAENYAINYKNSTRLEALQKWVDETYKASEAIANERNK